MDLLDAVRRRIEAGDREGARRALASLVRAEPQNVAAWALLADLLEDPARQADCYRQILRLDPGNRRAAAQLRARTGEAPGLPGIESPTLVEKPDRLAGLWHLLGIQGTGQQTSTGRGRTSPKQEPLSPDDVIQLAGGPLPPEERRTCPHCEAVIPKGAAKCAWCGSSLSDPGEPPS